MTPAHGSSASPESSDPLACSGCGQLLYVDQPMVAAGLGAALHVGCHRLAAIQLRHGPEALLGETLPSLRP